MLAVGIKEKVCEKGSTCSADKKRQSESKGAPAAKINNTAVFIDSPKKADHQSKPVIKANFLLSACSGNTAMTNTIKQ